MDSDSAPEQKRHIVIIGGGIIGCTTAYYLTRHPSYDPALHKITLLEASSIAAGASGKAGGLLALWAYPDCLVPLSYRLHAELAKEHNGAERWGYRRVGCGTITAVVKDADMKRHAAEAAARGRSAPVAEGADGQTSPPQPSPVQNGGGSDLGAGGDNPPEAAAAAPAFHPEPPKTENPLPVQSSLPDPTASPSSASEKTWEKLPKQDAAATAQLHDSPLPPDLDWVDGSLVRSYEVMGGAAAGESGTETAQVHPFQFTTAMAELARSAGVDIRLGAQATRLVQQRPRAAVEAVEYLDRATGRTAVLAGGALTDVVVAAGPWTGRLLPRSKVEGLRAHSVVLAADVSPHAVFTDIQLPPDWAPPHRRARGERRKHRGNVDPEIYARPGGEVYACGEPDTAVPLPETADRVQVDEAQCDDLAAYIGTVSPALAGAPVRARQACYLPRHMRFGEERGPLVGPTAVPGLWVAAGHTCWGIQNGPATGLLMAEMLFGGEARSADVEKLDPRKFKV